MTKSFGKIFISILTALFMVCLGLGIAFLVQAKVGVKAEEQPICRITETGDVDGTYTTYNYDFKTVDEVQTAFTNGLQGTFTNFYGLVINFYADMELPEMDYAGNHARLEVYLNGHTLKLTGSRNYASEHIELHNGVIDFSGETVAHTGNVFSIDKISNNAWEVSGLSLESITLQNIKASRLFIIHDVGNDGGSYWTADSVTIKDGTFTHDGGAFYIEKSKAHPDILFRSCNFINLHSTSNGGAIYVKNMVGTTEKGASIEMYDTDFINCSADNYGGAIYVYEMNASSSKKAKIVMSACNFLNCSAKNSGGAIYLDDEYIYLGYENGDYWSSKTLFSGCVSNIYGGAIYDDNGCNTIENMIFVNNEAKDDDWGGGAIHIYGSDTSIKNCEFYSNKGAGFGGAVSVDADDSVFTNCVFAGNTSSKGKDIYVGSDKDTPTITGCTVYGYSSTNSFRKGNNGIGDSAKNTFNESVMKFFNGSNYDNQGNLVKGDTKDNPILLEDAFDMIAFAVNIKLDSTTYASKYYKLAYSITNVCIPVRDFTGEIDFNNKTLYTRIQDKLFDDSEVIFSPPVSIKNVFGDNEKYIINTYYVDCSNEPEEIKFTTATPIFDGDDITELTEGYYYISGTVNLEKRLSVNGNVKIIFGESATLNAKNGIELQDENILSLYSVDEKYKGTLNAICAGEVGAGIGGNIAEYVLENAGHLYKKEYIGAVVSYPGRAGGNMGTLNVIGVNVNAQGNGGAGIGGGKGSQSEYIFISDSSIEWIEKYGSTMVQFITHAGIGGKGGILNAYNATINAVGNGGRDIGGGNGGDGVLGYGGGHGGVINVYSGVINAKNCGIGGGNGGIRNQGGSSVNEYIEVWQEYPDGGNAGELNLYSGQVYANTMSGGKKVNDTEEYLSSDGAPITLNSTNFIIKTGNSFNTLGDTVIYSTELYDSLRLKSVWLNKIKSSCNHILNPEDGICELCNAAIVVNVSFHTTTTQSFFVSCINNIQNTIKNKYNDEKGELYKIIYANGTEVADDEKFTYSEEVLNIYAIIKVSTGISGTVSNYYYNCFDNCCYEDGNCTIKIDDLIEWLLSACTEISFARGHTSIPLSIGNYDTLRAEMEFSPFSYTNDKSIGHLHPENVWRFVNCESGSYFDIGQEWLQQSIDDGSDRRLKAFYRFGKTENSKLILGEKYNVTFGYSKVSGDNFTYIFQITQNGINKIKQTASFFQGSVLVSHCLQNNYGNFKIFIGDMAIHSFKLYDNQTLIHDLVPMKDVDNNVFFFDKCTKTFVFGNFTTANSEIIDLGTSGKVYHCMDNGKYYTDEYCTKEVDVIDITYTGDYEGSYFGYKQDFVLPVCAEQGKNFVFFVDGEVWDGTTFMKDKFTVNVLSLKKYDKIDATCTTDGREEYYEYDGEYYSDKECTQKIDDLVTWLSSDGDGFIEALGHDYEITYEWNGQDCTATAICKYDNSHKIIKTITGVYVKDIDATETTHEFGHYEATFENEIFEKQSTEANSVKVNKTQIAKPQENTTTFTYNGQSQTYTLAINANYTITNNTKTNAGTYEVKVALNDKTKFEWTNGTTIDLIFTFVIAKANYDMSGITFENATYTYNGQEKTLVISGTLPNGVSVNYSTNTLTNAGSVEVTAIFTGDETNYNKIQSMTATLTITKATNEILTLSLESWNYGETPNTPTATAKFGEVKLVYSKATPRDFSITTLPTEAGNYIVKAYVDGNENYDGADKELKFAIIFISQDKNGNPIEEPQVSIVDSGNAIPQGAIFVVEVIDMEDTTATNASTQALKNNNKLANNEKIYAIYDAELLKENAPVQPNGNIKLKMQVPEELLGQQFKIYHIHTIGKTTEVFEIDNANIDEEGYVTFETNKLSQFAFVVQNEAINSTMMIIIIAGAVVVLGAIITTICISKRKAKLGK